MRRRFALIGPGRLGQAVARLLVEAGLTPVAIVSRDPERARQAARFADRPDAATTDMERVTDAKLILLTVPDDALVPVARKLHQLPLRSGTVLVHFSGYHPAEILGRDPERGIEVLALHPLQTFADSVMGVKNLPGSPISVQGSDAVLSLGIRLARALKGKPFRLEGEKKPLYHAAASVLCNHLIANTRAACEIMAACGIERDKAFELLKPLLTGTVRNLSALGPEQALTGPISRGDMQTVTAHLEAMRELPADLQRIYCTLAQKAVDIALERGSIDAQCADELRRLLDSALPPA